MKKIITIASLFALILFVLALPMAGNAAVLTVGNDNTARSQVDSASNFTIIDTNHPASELGLLTSFDYYATSTNPFRFVLVDSALKVLWLSEQITPATTGAQTYTLSGYVAVHAGDNLGLYFPSTGTIPFESTGASASYTVPGSGLAVVGSTLAITATSTRTYSFVANGQSGVLPSVPSIISPLNSSTLTSANFNQVDWTDSTGSFSPLTYQYESYSDAAYSNLLYQSDWLATSSIATVGSGAGTYYLHVRTQDNLGNLSAWSNSSTTPFVVTINNSTTTVSGLPTIPAITSPANGSTVTSAALTKVDWTNSSASSTPVTYQYEAYSDAAYTALIFQSGWLNASEIPTAGTPNGDYYIRVRSKDNSGNLSAWSNGATNTYRFSVGKTSPTEPKEKDYCYKYGWRKFGKLGFKNQGQCISYVNSHYKNKGHGKRTEFGGKNQGRSENGSGNHDNKFVKASTTPNQTVHTDKATTSPRQFLQSIRDRFNSFFSNMKKFGKNKNDK